MNAKEIKKNSYAPQVSSSNRAKKDKKKVKNLPKNNVNSKIGFYDPLTKCTSFAITEEKLKRQVELIRAKEGK